MNSDLIDRKETTIYLRKGFICFVYNPFGKYWRMWIYKYGDGWIGDGYSFNTDMWYALNVIIMSRRV